MRKAVGTLQPLGEKSADQNGKTSDAVLKNTSNGKKEREHIGLTALLPFCSSVKQVKQEFIGKGRYSPTCSRNEVPAHLFWMVNSS